MVERLCVFRQFRSTNTERYLTPSTPPAPLWYGCAQRDVELRIRKLDATPPLRSDHGVSGGPLIRHQ